MTSVDFSKTAYYLFRGFSGEPFFEKRLFCLFSPLQTAFTAAKLIQIHKNLGRIGIWATFSSNDLIFKEKSRFKDSIDIFFTKVFN